MGVICPLSVYPNFSEIISIVRAHIYFKLGNNKKAKEVLVELVNKYENTYLGHKLLAECYEKEGGMRRAIDEYVTAVDINKKDYKSYFKIADLNTFQQNTILLIKKIQIMIMHYIVVIILKFSMEEFL